MLNWPSNIQWQGLKRYSNLQVLLNKRTRQKIFLASHQYLGVDVTFPITFIYKPPFSPLTCKAKQISLKSFNYSFRWIITYSKKFSTRSGREQLSEGVEGRGWSLTFLSIPWDVNIHKLRLAHAWISTVMKARLAPAPLPLHRAVHLTRIQVGVLFIVS